MSFRHLLVVIVALGISRTNAQETRWPGEHKSDVLNAPATFLVTQAIAQNREYIPLIIAANRGQTEAVEQLVSAQHGTVLSTIPEIGYVYAIFPVNRVWWLQSQPSVSDLEVAGESKFGHNLRGAIEPEVKEDIPEAKLQAKLEEEQERKFDESQKAPGKLWGNVDLALPFLPPELLSTKPGLNANAYLGQPEWLSAHPTWDGRGVTIVSTEGLPGPDHPALQEAKDIQGNSIKKIAGMIDATDFTNRNPAGYFDEGDVLHWGEVKFGTQPHLSDGTRCSAPESPTQKVGVWKGFHYELRTEYCVEWSPADRVARIDINRNGRFNDDPPLGDFNQTHDFVKIPYSAKVDNGQPAHSFTAYLLYDQLTGAVTLLPTDDHTAMTSSAATGTGYLGTAIGGMAPSSRLIYFQGDRLNEVIEGLWQAASRPDVDLITNSSSIGGDSFANDGRTVTMMFLDRIMEVTGKPIVSAAGNHGLPFEEGYGRGRLMIGVGGYISDAQLKTFRHNERSIRLPNKDYVFDDSSSGPSPDGSFSTDILTPELGIAGADCGSDHDSGAAVYAQIGFTYRFPPCYSMGSGTSAATPRAAGAVALLLSAAKQQHLKVNAAQIKNALIVSARFLPEQPAFRQGPGLLQVGEAWNALEEAARKPPISIIPSTPDISPLYPQFWNGPLNGKSVYVTRGFHPGDKKQLRLNLDVSGMPAADLSFHLLGDDGTFQITLKQISDPNRVTVSLAAETVSIGNKSTILEVRAEGWKYPVARFPILIVATPAPEQLRTGVSLKGKYDVASSDFFVFEPPEGTAALEIDGKASGEYLDVEFVMSTNPTFGFEPSHGGQWASSILNGQRKYILPLLHSDIVGIKITNSRVGEIPDQPTEFNFTVRALTRQEITSAASRDASTHTVSALTVMAENQLPTHSVPGTPLREVSVNVPSQGIDSLVISFPEVSVDQATPYATQVYLYAPSEKRRDAGLWNYYPVITRDTLLAIPKPHGGEWKLMIMGLDPGRVKVEFLHKTEREMNPSERRYLAFGSLCRGRACADTWPLDDPLWRFMPLFPFRHQPKFVSE